MLKLRKREIKGYEQVVIGEDTIRKFKAIIAVHSTLHGPSLGGIRMRQFDSFQAGLSDVLRLSGAMSKKAVMANLKLGGGKAVIFGNPLKDKTPSLFEAMGEMIESLGGAYYGAEDSGISPHDLDIVSSKTSFLTGTSKGKGGSGDPSLSTAKGVLYGIEACLKQKFKTDKFDGVTVAIQGIGQVGWNLSELLIKKGAQVVVSDVVSNRCRQLQEELGVKVVSPEKIYQVKADVFSPCAFGGVLNPQTIDQLQVSIVAGGANNQMEKENRDAKFLASRGILHAPDYVINAGGLIHLYVKEILNENKLAPYLYQIPKTLREIFELSTNNPPLVVSNKLAQERLVTFHETAV